MATRFYLVAADAPAGLVPAADAGWPDASVMVRRFMSTVQSAATETLSGVLSGSIGDYDAAVQLFSAPLAAQTITGTYTITSRGRQLAASGITKRARMLKVVAPDGTVRGTQAVWAATASTTALLTSLAGQIHATGGALTSVAAQAGDRLCVELGYGASNTGTTPTWEMVLGGTGTDHANANGDTTGTVPWVEYSATITFATPSDVPPAQTRRMQHILVR